MSLTPTEEAQTRQLIAQEAPLLTLAASEATIISKLGATKVNLSQLPAATTVADADLLLIRQGTTDKGVPASAIKTYATSAASETVAGIVRLATDAEVAAATSRLIAVDPAGLAVSSQKSSTITAVATGTADALVATFVPAITTVANQTILVRATAANATTTPTINPGSGAIVIVKGNNLPLVAGDIAGAGHWLEITLDTTLGKANLQNPANGVNAGITQTAADTRYAKLAGLSTQAFAISTAAQFDNTTNGASTAFVQRALGSFAGISGINATTTWTAATGAGRLIYILSSTQTLPLANTMPPGTCIAFISQAASSVSLNCQGSDTFSGGLISGLGLSQINPSEVVIFTSDGIANYKALYFNGGTGLTPQTWQGVTRAIGTTYTNSTGRSIVLAFTGLINSVNGSYSVTVNGVVVVYSSQAYANSATVQTTTIIPSNATYSINNVSGSTTTSFSTLELR